MLITCNCFVLTAKAEASKSESITTVKVVKAAEGKSGGSSAAKPKESKERAEAAAFLKVRDIP